MTEIRRRLRQLAASAFMATLGALALLAVASCGGRSAPPAIDAPAPIRLIDHLGSAEISSPLAAAPALDALLDDLPALGARRVWSADLEGEETRRRDCLPLAGGGLHCRDDQASFRLELTVPAARADYSVVVLELRAEQPGCVLLEVWDRAERRRLALPPGGGGWRRLPVLWRPAASELSVRLGRRRLPGPCELSVRSVEVHGLDAGPELRLALLRSRSAVAGAAAAGGIGGFGTFLPLADAESVRPPFDENFSSREVLLAAAPTTLGFRLRVPRRARLGFSYALSRETAPGAAVDFEIRVVEGAGDERTLWSDRLVAAAESWHWHEAVVSLEPLAGKTVELVLATRSSSAAGLALWGTPTVEAPRAAGGPPNVVLIAVDTLRADRLSTYGYARPTSPRLDELAADGVLFRQATSQSNWTLPSFASIFTGKIVPRHRLATFADRLAPGAVTLQRLFREHGWRTQAVLYKAALYQRLDRGFESSFNVPLRERRADRNLATALDRLARLGDQRFFLFVHFDDPHQPFTQPAEFVDRDSVEGLRELGLELPLNLPAELPRCSRCLDDGRPGEAVRALTQRLYDGEIRYVDDRIGALLDELRRLGLYERAVVAFVSDHGETLWSHHDYLLHGSANLHDELIRVPLIVKAPAAGGYGRGAVVDGRVSAFDLMPTLLDLAGIEVPPGLDAATLAPLLRHDGGAAPAAERVAYSQGSSSAALLFERWKYITPVGRGVPPGQEHKPSLAGEELYDLEADPGELRELSAVEPARLAELRRRAIDYVVGAVGGRFLLVAGEAGGRLEVECEPACRWDPLLQLGRERSATADPRVDAFTGPGLGEGVPLLARLAAGSGEPVRARLGAAGSGVTAEVRRVELGGGGVEGLLAQDGPRAWLISAPERQADRPEEAALDPQQEDALRALGYID